MKQKRKRASGAGRKPKWGPRWGKMTRINANWPIGMKALLVGEYGSEQAAIDALLIRPVAEVQVHLEANMGQNPNEVQRRATKLSDKTLTIKPAISPAESKAATMRFGVLRQDCFCGREPVCAMCERCKYHCTC